jgi:hypothetical protein
VHNWKYSEAFAAVRRCLDTGAIGALRRIVFEAERDGCSAMVGANWRMQAATAGGGIMVDHGWHALYLVLALADAVPRRVRATMQRRRYTDIDVEDTAHCRIDFDGVTAEINLTWAAPARRTCWRFEGQAGELIVDDDRLIVRRGGTAQRATGAGAVRRIAPSGVVRRGHRRVCPRARRPDGAWHQSGEAEWCLLLLRLAYASAPAAGRRSTCRPSRRGSTTAWWRREDRSDFAADRCEFSAGGGHAVAAAGPYSRRCVAVSIVCWWWPAADRSEIARSAADRPAGGGGDGGRPLARYWRRAAPWSCRVIAW